MTSQTPEENKTYKEIKAEIRKTEYFKSLDENGNPPEVTEIEEFATQLSKSVRYSSGRGQYDAFPDCQDAYLDGVETAIAMMYIDLTGTPKSEGMLAKFNHHQLQKAREEERDRILSVVADALAENCELFVANDVKFSIAQAITHSELDQDKVIAIAKDQLSKNIDIIKRVGNG